MSLTREADVLAALHRALDALEARSGWRAETPLARIIVQRRLTLRRLEQALDGAKIPGVAASFPGPSAAARDMAALIRQEEHLAELADAWLADLAGDDPRRALAERLRTEADEAARVLRLMQAARQ